MRKAQLKNKLTTLLIVIDGIDTDLDGFDTDDAALTQAISETRTALMKASDTTLKAIGEIERRHVKVPRVHKAHVNDLFVHEKLKAPKRLIAGMRARILTLEEVKAKLGKSDTTEGYYWNENHGGEHALLQERNSSGGFSILIIGEKFKEIRKLPKETTGVIDGGGAWVDEDTMEFVNADFDINLDYMDWYQGHEDDFCGDCGEWYPNKNDRCPNKECPGARWDNGECPDCGTKLTGKNENYCKKCKEHIQHDVL